MHSDGFTELEYQKIPYRATRTERVLETGEIVWHIEYKQAQNYDWGPRGIFTELNETFLLGGREFESAYEALRHRAVNG